MTMATGMAMRRAIRPDFNRASIRGGPVGTRRWLEILFIAILCVIGIWFTFSVGIAAVVRDRDPVLALRLWPGDARALVIQADNQLLTNPGRREFAIAKTLAQQSLARDPTGATALRVLGFAKDRSGDIAGARKMISASERLSRRDLAGQLWMINDAVARDQAEEALGHFDTALRTSDLAPPMLLPVLARATEDTRLIAPLATMLAKRPLWGPSFVSEAIHHGPAPQNLVLLDEALRVRGVPLSRPLVQQLVDQLVALNRFDDALTIYSRAIGQAEAVALVRDQKFEHESQLTPFDWMIGSSDSISVSRTLDGDGINQHQLAFTASAGGSGDLARQLLVLPPGEYRASVDADVKGADVRMSLSCADIARLGLAETPIAGRRSSGVFVVPSQGCKAQWIAIKLITVADLDGASGWVDKVSITSGKSR